MVGKGKERDGVMVILKEVDEVMGTEGKGVRDGIEGKGKRLHDGANIIKGGDGRRGEEK